ncbi:Alpha/Beta hydrolase protein [Zopfochytrium polystomum]|nr:Alpha/Beta hydrolase protein [Zopfochytrium polystomum]
MRVEDYCEHAGYSCEAIETATDDGFVLVVHHIGRKDGAPPGRLFFFYSLIAITTNYPDRGPVILMHGLFQSAGVWVTNGRSSFAFYLVDQGYDVWLGNNRTVFPRHLRYHPSSPAFWNWSLDDLAIHDIPTLLALVRHKTRRPRVAYVGHSQGNSQMFLALALNPSLNAHLSVFVALAPAVYLGPLLDSFPVNLLMRCPSALYRRLFGVKGFLPVMGVVQRWAPPMVFMTLAYHMFHYLFGWTDTNWNPANKPAYFQFTPRPQSAKLLHHWAQMGSAKVVQPFRAQHPPSPASASASPATPHYDVTAVRCPLALYYGTKDTIVDARRLHRECWAARGRGVRLVAVEEVDGYEHMDCLWAVDAGAKVWRRVVKVLEGVEEVEMERAAASR